MFIRRVVIVLVLISLSSIALAKYNDEFNRFMPGREPTGFRGIQWGTPIFNLESENFKLLKSDGDEKIYIKEDENYMLDVAKVDKIEYYFWQDAFYKVNIYAKGASKKSRLAIYVLRQFGRARKIEGCYRYKGSSTGVMFCNQPGKDLTVLTIYSLFHFYRKD